MFKKLYYLLFSLFFLFILCSCSVEQKKTEDIYPKLENWETLTLGSELPPFDNGDCYLERDNDSLLSIIVENVSQEMYGAYIRQCTEFGFTYTMDSDDSFFRSYDSDNAELVIRYSADTKKLEICLYAPVECTTLNIPPKVAEYLPALPSQTGYEKINWEDTYEFVVNGVTKDSFDAFVNQCNAQFGYALHSNNGSYFYGTENSANIDLNLEFCGNGLVDISFCSVDCNIADLPSINPESDDLNTASSASSASSESTLYDSVFYSTNDEATAKIGNSGIFSYKSRGGVYDNYYIIDFDSSFIYFFSHGNGNSTCDRLKIDSGDLNSSVIFTYHDSDSSWSECLHFKYKNQPDHLVLEDSNGFEYDYYTTDHADALAIRDSMEIIDY